MDKLGDGAKVADKLGEGAKVLDKLEDGSKTVNKIGKAKETASTVKQAGKGTGKLNQVKRYKNNLGEYKNDLTKKITQAAEELSGKPGDTLQDIRNGLNRMMGESQPAYAGGSIDKAGDASRAETWYHKSNVMKSEGNTGGGVHIGGPKKEGGINNSNTGAVDSSNKTINSGATRAAKYSSEWGDVSLQDAIHKFAPDVELVVTAKGKVIYNNKETGISVVYDINGNYFRIEDTTRPRGKNYLDINGNDMNNEIVSGKTQGRRKDDYQRVTHFNNSDK